MSVDRGPLLPRGGRSRSYGSVVRVSPACTAVPRRAVEHPVRPGDTLQGLALAYGVSMEQIKRANRLYTNDSIFVKKVLLIPAAPLAGPEAYSRPALLKEGDPGEPSSRVCALGDGDTGLPVTVQQGTAAADSSELSPMDFLKRMDALIRQSKKAAVQGCHDGEKRFAAIQAACNLRAPEHRCLTRSQSAMPALSQQTSLAAVPLTVTKHTKSIRASEDELFQL